MNFLNIVKWCFILNFLGGNYKLLRVTDRKLATAKTLTGLYKTPSLSTKLIKKIQCSYMDLKSKDFCPYCKYKNNANKRHVSNLY